MAFTLFGSNHCSLPTRAQVEEVINGCQAECDKKCVVDNYEVEIIHDGAASEHSLWDPMHAMQCLSARVADWCRSERMAPIAAASERGDQSARTYQPKFGLQS
eukprot:TRINITY_DN28085_c0_g1_i1.p1 TRINITY_DN28085_c0_g1~~TRINITY_DN28085_c0_g1_i1.p1  ORF type:complete len:116 (-),score=18.08 TRINITY_DN28085_c0_g1_i1:101-409(-)